VNAEREYLNKHGYEEDIESKLYKSIKYYYIKKYSTDSPKPLPVVRSYVPLPKEIMDQIKTDINEAFADNPRFKPSVRFECFKKDVEFDGDKLKKAYKNQYYQIKSIKK